MTKYRILKRNSYYKIQYKLLGLIWVNASETNFYGKVVPILFRNILNAEEFIRKEKSLETKYKVVKYL